MICQLCILANVAEFSPRVNGRFARFMSNSLGRDTAPKASRPPLSPELIETPATDFRLRASELTNKPALARRSN
jgi:hypothetical protein